MILEICLRVLNRKGMPNEWQNSVMVSVVRRKGDERNCNVYREVKLLEHAIKIVKWVLARKIRELGNAVTMQLSFIPCRGMTDALFVLRRMQEQYRDKKKNCICFFVNIENAFE